MDILKLPNGGLVERLDYHAQLPVSAHQQGLIVEIAGGGARLRITLPSTTQLVGTAAAVGAQLADELPNVLVLVLAAMVFRDKVPGTRSLRALERYAGDLHFPTTDEAEEIAPLGVIREVIRRKIAEGPQHEYVDQALIVSQRRWNAARAIFVYGEEAWGLRGELSQWWGSSPRYFDPRKIAGFTTLQLAASILHEDSPTEAILDRLSVAPGPDPIPSVLLEADEVDNPAIHYTEEEHAIFWEQSIALSRLAQALLAEVDRPAPRYLGQALDVALPSEVLPRLTAFSIHQLRIYPRREGMYVAALNANGEQLSCAWWAAQPTSGDRVPVSFGSAAWLFVHVVLAALWHDLCADAVEVERPTAPSASGGRAARPGGAPRRAGPRIAVMPPVRYARAAWAEGEEVERIRQVAHFRSGDYRRLPGDYEERVERKDFQRRQSEAAQRAEAHGYPAPPPGYTFVRPHVRGGDREDQAQPASAALKVRSRGLFTLMLGLAQQAEFGELLIDKS